MKMRSVTVMVGLLSLLTLGTAAACTHPSAIAEAKNQPTASSRQLIVWASADREVALNTVLMYANGAKTRGWMNEVRLLIWGPSGRLLAEDKEVQAEVAKVQAAGVEVFVCKACADKLGVSDKLAALGLKVMYVGTMLADAQKEGWHVLSF